MVNKPSCHICFQEFIGECHNANAIVVTLCAFLKLTEKLLRKCSFSNSNILLCMQPLEGAAVLGHCTRHRSAMEAALSLEVLA